MKKIIVISLLVIFMFLVSCAPQITDEELEAELAKLTPEEREQLLKDLESKSAFAGQAVKQKAATKYGLSKNATVASKAQITKAVNKLLAEAPALKDISPEFAAEDFCNKPENAGKKKHFCSELSNNELKYDRFRCTKDTKAAVHEIDTTYKRSLLYLEVDTCQEILGTFLDKPDYATIGCYDSDGGVNGAEKGYVEIIQLQTGNKYPAAPSAAANPIKEVDACSGNKVNSDILETSSSKIYTYGCTVGYYGEYIYGKSGKLSNVGYPPPGYVDPETPCLYSVYGTYSEKTNYYALYGGYLFERKCPALFKGTTVEDNTERFNCGYETGYNCFRGRCDETTEKSCWHAEWCKELGPRYVLISSS